MKNYIFLTLLIVTANLSTLANAGSSKQDIVIAVPSGWTATTSENKNIIQLVGPGDSFKMTLISHQYEAKNDHEVKEFAAIFITAQSEHFESLAKQNKSDILYTDTRLFKDITNWQLRSAVGLSNGQSLRNLTFFESNRSISILAESISAGQPELEKALMQMAAGIGFNVRATRHARSCHEAKQETDFKKALTSFRKKNFRDANEEFSSFIKNYPNDPLVYNAYFWKGNSQYATRDYAAALSSLASIAYAPSHHYAADALFTIAAIQFETGYKSLARANFERLIERFPDSNAAIDAHRRLGLPPPPIRTQPGDSYAVQVTKAIRGNLRYSGTEQAIVEVAVQVECDGKIAGLRITKPSEKPEWDNAVVDAIRRTEYIPLDINGLTPRELIVSFNTK